MQLVELKTPFYLGEETHHPTKLIDRILEKHPMWFDSPPTVLVNRKTASAIICVFGDQIKKAYLDGFKIIHFTSIFGNINFIQCNI